MGNFRHRLKSRRKTYIREWRKYRRMTQQQVADQIGATVGAISQLETGANGYTQPMLEALADALQCGVADLLTRNPADTGAIWSLWDKAEKGQRAQIEAVARAIVGDPPES